MRPGAVWQQACTAYRMRPEQAWLILRKSAEVVRTRSTERAASHRMSGDPFSNGALAPAIRINDCRVDQFGLDRLMGLEIQSSRGRRIAWHWPGCLHILSCQEALAQSSRPRKSTASNLEAVFSCAFSRSTRGSRTVHNGCCAWIA
jgi:hypothetical protein